MKSYKEFMKAAELKCAYIFCSFHILVDLAAGVIGVLIFLNVYSTEGAKNSHGILILALLFGLFVLGADIHGTIFRDLKHIRSTDPNRNSNIGKNKETAASKR